MNKDMTIVVACTAQHRPVAARPRNQQLTAKPCYQPSRLGRSSSSNREINRALSLFSLMEIGFWSA